MGARSLCEASPGRPSRGSVSSYLASAAGLAWGCSGMPVIDAMARCWGLILGWLGGCSERRMRFGGGGVMMMSMQGEVRYWAKIVI